MAVSSRPLSVPETSILVHHLSEVQVTLWVKLLVNPAQSEAQNCRGRMKNSLGNTCNVSQDSKFPRIIKMIYMSNVLNPRPTIAMLMKMVVWPAPLGANVLDITTIEELHPKCSTESSPLWKLPNKKKSLITRYTF